jgi:hypothetical protein
MSPFLHRAGRLHPLVCTLFLGGCYDDSGYHSQQGYYPDGATVSCSSGSDSQGIDSGRYLELDPGSVGVTAEAFAEGAWRFAMACDTPRSGAVCHYDLTVTPVDGSISSFTPESLEEGDVLSSTPGAYGADAVNLDAFTDYDIDGFTLTATPGSTLELNVVLDGNCAAPFLFWIEANNVVSGQKTLTDLTPSSP